MTVFEIPASTSYKQLGTRDPPGVVFTYLKANLEAIAAYHPASWLEELLPWTFPPSS